MTTTDKSNRYVRDVLDKIIDLRNRMHMRMKYVIVNDKIVIYRGSMCSDNIDDETYRLLVDEKYKLLEKWRKSERYDGE